MVAQRISVTSLGVIVLSFSGNVGFLSTKAIGIPLIYPRINRSNGPDLALVESYSNRSQMASLRLSDYQRSEQSSSQIILETSGTLETGDYVAYQDGSLYDEYEIDGIGGQHVKIRLESLEFDPYLVLLDPNGNILAQNDDIAPNNYNAYLDLVLPLDGTYRVVANGFDRHSRGQYQLTILTPLQEPNNGDVEIHPDTLRMPDE